jgi:hypothetical protein
LAFFSLGFPWAFSITGAVEASRVKSSTFFSMSAMVDVYVMWWRVRLNPGSSHTFLFVGFSLYGGRDCPAKPPPFYAVSDTCFLFFKLFGCGRTLHSLTLQRFFSAFLSNDSKNFKPEAFSTASIGTWKAVRGTSF